MWRILLKEVFESLLNKTIWFEKLEVILIDDNSADDSLNIPNIMLINMVMLKLFFIDKNCGSGVKPGDVGLTHVTKDYVMFLDENECL